VSVERGVTLNLGDYESMRFSVGLTMPCRAEVQAIQRAYDVALAWVDARVNEEVEKASEIRE